MTIAVCQGIWLFLLMRRGWYLQSELSNLSEARSSGLTWSYLTRPLAGHFGPVTRFEYWALAHTVPLSYSFTVVVRAASVAVSAYLLWRLMRLLVGDRPGLVVITALYGVSPLLVPGVAWLTSGIGSPALILVVLALHHITLYATEDRLRDAVVAAGSMAVAILMSDLCIGAAYLLPAVAICFGYRGSLSDRARRLRRQLVGWTIVAAPFLAYGLYYLSSRPASSGSSGSSTTTSPTTLLALMRDEWLKSVGPSLVGGPWRWYAGPDTYVGYAAPPQTLIFAGQAVFVVLVFIGIRISGAWRTVAAWSMPVIVAATSIVIVGISRYDAYGALIPLTLRYSMYVPIAVALAVALSLTPDAATSDAATSDAATPDAATPDAATSDAATSDAATSGAGQASPLSAGRLSRARVTIACIVLVISCGVSAIRFIDRYQQSPARAYVHNLVADAHRLGPTVNIYDTAIPEQIVSGVEPDHHVSNLLSLAGISAQFGNVTRPELVVDNSGHLRYATFVAASSGVGGTRPHCGFYLSGSGRWRIDLSRSIPRAEWFLRLSLYQNTPSVITVRIEDADGTTADPINGAVIDVPTNLAQINRRLPVGSPAAVVIATQDRNTSICLSEVAVGGPSPAAAQ